MAEIFNVLGEINKNTYMGHLILEGTGEAHHQKINDLLKTVDYDGHKVNLELTLNGVVFQSMDIETLLKGWVKRIMDQQTQEIPALIRRIELLKTEEGLKEEAMELAKNMCYKMADKFEYGDL